MSSIVYTSFLEDLARGNIDVDVDVFKAMVVGAAYTEDKDTHTKRSDITNETSGTGYTAGGQVVTVTFTKDNANDRLDLTISSPSWASSTFAGQKLVVYKSRGGASSADELVCCIDNGSSVSSSNSTFNFNVTAPLRFQN